MVNRRTYFRMALLICAAAMLVLQGCGGDDNGVSQSMHDQVVMERDAAKQAEMDAKAEADKAKQAEMDAKAEADKAKQAEMDAKAEADKAKQAEMDAKAEADKAKGERDDLQTQADKAKGERDDLQTQADKDKMAADTAMAKALGKALMMAKSDMEDRLGTPDNADDDTEQIPNPMYVTKMGDNMISVSRTSDGLMGKISTKEFDDYMQSEDMPPMLGDDMYNGITLTRMIGGATETAYVYSDIGSSDGVPFDRMYDLMGGKYLIMDDDDGDDPDAGVDNDIITAADAGKISFDAPFGTDDMISVDTEGEMGTFHGVPGTYTCMTGTVTTCIVTRGDMLTIDEEAMLYFKPTDRTQEVVTGMQDKDYLYFGWWLKELSSGDFMFETFAYGSEMFETDKLADAHLKGRAKYEGSAAGKYVKRDLTADTAKAGIFTATAKLLADFDDPTPTDAAGGDSHGNDRFGRIDGSIEDFMANGELLGNWKVTLKNVVFETHAAEGPTDLTSDNRGADANWGYMDTFEGMTDLKIGAASSMDAGRWEAMFYGNMRDDGEPGSVAGRFNAHTPSVEIAGAFGAHNMNPDE